MKERCGPRRQQVPPEGFHQRKNRNRWLSRSNVPGAVLSATNRQIFCHLTRSIVNGGPVDAQIGSLLPEVWRLPWDSASTANTINTPPPSIYHLYLKTTMDLCLFFLHIFLAPRVLISIQIGPNVYLVWGIRRLVRRILITISSRAPAPVKTQLGPTASARISCIKTYLLYRHFLLYLPPLF